MRIENTLGLGLETTPLEGTSRLPNSFVAIYTLMYPFTRPQLSWRYVSLVKGEGIVSHSCENRPQSHERLTSPMRGLLIAVKLIAERGYVVGLPAQLQ